MSTLERQYGLVATVSKLTPYLLTLLIGFEAWQTNEINRINSNQLSVLQWKTDIPNHMKTEAEKLRLEIMQAVQGSVGAQLVQIQMSQIRMEMAIEELKRKFSDASVAVQTK